MFAISGERLTMRIRQMAFKALLRQVLSHTHSLITSVALNVFRHHALAVNSVLTMKK